MPSGSLLGARVIVAGAGLAGLAAARDVEADGGTVTVIEARDRVGGRVHTVRGGFADGQHAEGGADLIEAAQTHVRELAGALGLETVRILRSGWGFYGSDAQGRKRIHRGPGAFAEAATRLAPEIRDYTIAERRWDSAISVALARRSVADWLRATDADPAFASGLRGLRGFFLADPEDLSLLALVDQFASDDTPGEEPMYRIRGGNDLLPGAIARDLSGTLVLNAVVTRIAQASGSVTVTILDQGTQRELAGDYCIAALPATTLRDVTFEPSLPEDQQRAIRSLRYGPATRVLLQFAHRFWRRPGRPSAYGSDLPVGAAWDGNEEQGRRPGILTLLAGGNASAAVRAILATGGEAGVLAQLTWLGTPARLITTRALSWEEDPWVRGGYAVFDPAFDPRWRAWLARPAGRVLFAGEHTSGRWQGYMNGAIESGKRAAAEVRALAVTPAFE